MCMSEAVGMYQAQVPATRQHTHMWNVSVTASNAWLVCCLRMMAAAADARDLERSNMHTPDAILTSAHDSAADSASRDSSSRLQASGTAEQLHSSPAA